MSSRLGRNTLREICKAGFPGAIRFSQTYPLRIPINRPIKLLRLTLPERGILNVASVKLQTLDGRPLPEFIATISSSYDAASRDPARLLNGTGPIHTQKEPLPSWEASFRSLVHAVEVRVSNRAGKWGARGYGLCVEWVDDTDRCWTYDNLGLDALLGRLRQTKEQFSNASDRAKKLDSVQAEQCQILDTFLESLFEHLNQVENSLRGLEFDLHKLYFVRAEIIDRLLKFSSTLSRAQLEALRELFEAAEGLIWSGADSSICEVSSELDLAAYVFGYEFISRGFVPLHRTRDIDGLLETEESVSYFEECVQEVVARLGGDAALFPIQIKAHGLYGSMLRLNEQKYVAAVREVVRQLELAGHPSGICYGTLLGIVREGRLIAHDDDVDVVFQTICHEESDLTLELLRIVQDLKQAGLDARLERGFLFLKIRSQNGLYVDAFPVLRTGDGIVRMYMKNLTIADVPQEFVLPFTPVDFYGKEIGAPAKPELFLQQRYGPNWRTPDRFYGLPWPVKKTQKAGQ